MHVLANEYAGMKRELTYRICNSLIDLDSFENLDETDKEKLAEISDKQYEESSEDEKEDARQKRRTENRDNIR